MKERALVLQAVLILVLRLIRSLRRIKHIIFIPGGRKVAVIMSKDGYRYDGEVKCGKPYGNGKIYAPGGRLAMEGRFGIKGLTEGKVYYPDGGIRFDGRFRVNRGYGPNYPFYGTVYDKDGRVLYKGKFSIRCSGLGYPYLKEAEELHGMTARDYKMHVSPYMWEDDKES